MERQAAMARDEIERQAAIDRARDKAKVFKKQAQIQAKIRKQQSLASNYSEQSSKRSSRHSKSSKLSTFCKELDRQLGLGSGEIKKELPSTTAFAPGISVGAATVQTDTQKISNWARERTTRNVEAFGAADIPETSHFAKAVDEVQMRSKVSDRMSQERYRDIPCPPGYEHFIPSSIKNKQRQPEVKQEMIQDHESLRSRKDFLDEAILIGYDGTNMPYVMFYNQIMNLLARCPYSNKKLPLLRAACLNTAAQTIAVVISDTPGFDDDAKINMALNRLLQRFGVHGGFVNEPEVQKIRNGPKMSSTSAAAWKTFRDELTQCFVYAHSYKKPELLEGRLVVDLARRLPNFAKQRFLDYLNDRCGSTCDPTFGNLMEFVKREEDSKSSDFSVQLMTDEKSERVTKFSDKSSVFPAVKVKKTSAQIENSNYRTGVGKLNRGSFPVKGVCVSDNRNNDLVIVPPQCFVCRLQNSDSCHKVVNCQTFRRMTPSERKEIVFKARRCFNCLEKHVVKDCVKNCDCRKCLGSNVGKHFFMLHDCFVSTVPKSPNNNARSARDGNIAGHWANENLSVPVRSVKIGSTKAALNRIVAARVINPHNGKSKLVYCQQDGGSQLTFVSNKLVQELNLIPYDQASFRMVTLNGETLTHTNLVKFDLQSLFSNEMFELSNVVTK